MFRAVENQGDAPVISLDPKWNGQLERLRARCRADLIVCPGCRQSVRLRAGERRRRHFAHRTLSDCPLSRESAEVLSARAMLYRILEQRYGDAVSLEVPVPGGEPKDRVDCVVALPEGEAAYFIVPKQITRNRGDFIVAREQAYAHVHWLLLPPLLRKDARPRRYLLSTTARHLADCDGVGQLYAERGGGGSRSLTYLYQKHETIVFLRGLHLVHRPNVFGVAEGLKVTGEQVVVHSRTGELMHPDEVAPYAELLAKRLAEEQERERLQQEAIERAARQRELDAKRRRREVERDKAAERLRDPLYRLEAGAREHQPGTPLLVREGQVRRKRDPALDEIVARGRQRAKQRDRGGHPGQLADESPSGKEFACLFCGCRTRYWQSFRYPPGNPGGECVCNQCHGLGRRLDGREQEDAKPSADGDAV